MAVFFSHVLAIGLMWGENFFKILDTISEVLWQTLISSLLSIFIIYFLQILPARRKVYQVFLSSIVVYISVFSLFAALRYFFSGNFLLLQFVFFQFFVFLSYWDFVSRVRLNFAHIEGNLPTVYSDLLKKSNIQWRSLGEEYVGEEDFLGLDAVVVWRKKSLSQGVLNRILDFGLRRVPILSAEDVYLDYMGRLPLSLVTNSRFLIKSEKRINRVLKRCFDLLVCLVLFPFWFLAMGFVSLLIFIVEFKQPLFFIQKRVGWKGRKFEIFKFRTMRAGDDNTSFTVEGDSRITFLGAVLRKTHLDEIPQFINILKGEMSWVGPRPEQVDVALRHSKDSPFFSLRELVLPGLTGWAQLEMGYANTMAQLDLKLEFDLYYVKNNSMSLDFLILARTFKRLLFDSKSK